MKINSQTQIETESLDEESNEQWNKVEETILEFFEKIDLEPNDALNILLHTAVHIAIMGGVEKDALLGGMAMTYDNTVEGFSVEGEVH